MSTYNFKNVNIKGDNNHFGDKFLNYETFINDHPNLEGFEESVAQSIYELIDDKTERDKLISSYLRLRENKKHEVDSGEMSLWVKFKDKLIEAGMEETVNALKEFLKKYSLPLYLIIRSQTG